MRKFFDRPELRFLLAGGLNTALTYLLYLAALAIVPYPAAYTISYVAGIFLAFVLNSLVVFRVPLRWRKLAQFPLVYVVQFGLGALVLWLAVEILGVDPRLGPAAVVAVTVPATFFLSRWVLAAPR